MEIHLNMYQTLAVAVLVLLFGNFLRHRIGFLEKFCIPAPVIGGLLFAILTCLCYVTGIAEFSFDDTLREVCMVFFFTSVGFQANLKVLKSGGTAMADPRSCRCTDYMSEPSCRGIVPCPALKSADWYVYRLHPNGRRSWYSRSIRSCIRRL